MNDKHGAKDDSNDKTDSTIKEPYAKNNTKAQRKWKTLKATDVSGHLLH